MSKIIDSLVQADIDSADFAGVLLARFEFASPIGTMRFTNSQQSVYWDEAGGGEVAYSGVGNLAGIQPVPETNDLSAQGMQFTLSGIPNSTITGVFNQSAYQGKPCYLWYALLDKQTFAVRGGQNGPILIFAGLMDYCNFEFGSSATISLIASSRLADWERPRGGRYNDPYQRRYVDPTDSGFKYVLPLQSKEVQWGGKSVLDPGGGDWAGQAGNYGGTGGGGCFTENTIITLEDGSKSFIKDIKKGMLLKTNRESQEVKSVFTRTHVGQIYSLNGSSFFVTDSHPFRTLQGWKAINPYNASKHNPGLYIEKLNKGDTLLKEDGSIEILKEIDSIFDTVTVYNFEVGGSQDYYANGYLVHNKMMIDFGE